MTEKVRAFGKATQVVSEPGCEPVAAKQNSLFQGVTCITSALHDSTEGHMTTG